MSGQKQEKKMSRRKKNNDFLINLFACSKLEFGDDRQMIRGDERRFAFMEKGVREAKILIEINMVEVKNGQDAGKGARCAEVRFGVDGLEFRFEKFGRQTFRPFVEIARDDAFAGKFRVFENVRVKQLVNLPAALEKRCAEMNVEKLEVFAFAAERDLGQKTAARFAFPDADVEILRMAHGQTAQNRVAVNAALNFAVLAEKEIRAEFFRQKFGLMLAFVRIRMTQNFLQSDHVGVDFPQNFGNPFRRKLAVDADAFVNVVGRDADFIHSGRWSVVSSR